MVVRVSSLVFYKEITHFCAYSCSGERWHEGSWEPVCIKKKPASTRSEHLSVWAERSALEAMRVAMQGQPGPHCVSYLLDSYPVGYPCSEWPGNEQEVYCILE